MSQNVKVHTKNDTHHILLHYKQNNKLDTIDISNVRNITGKACTQTSVPYPFLCRARLCFSRRDGGSVKITVTIHAALPSIFHLKKAQNGGLREIIKGRGVVRNFPFNIYGCTAY